MMNSSNKQPSFLFILPWSLVHLGGVNQVVTSLAKEMKKENSFEPIVLVASWDDVKPRWEEIHGIRVVHWRIRTSQFERSLKEKLSYWLWEQGFKYKFQKLCDEHNVKVLNMHYVGPMAFTFERIRKKLSPVLPLLLSFHGTDITTLRKIPTSDLVPWKKMLTNITSIIVCSKNLGDRFKDIFGETILPRVIYNGIDTYSFIRTNNKPPRPYGERYILSIGKFERQKGQDVLIEAFSEIYNLYPDVNLVLVGAKDNALTELQTLCNQRGICERTHFYIDIPHNEIPDFYQDAEIFVLPSRMEAFSIALLEAGAMSKPVIATDIGGIPEIIRNKVTGRLVPADSVSELVSSIRELLDNPLTAKKMGRNLNEIILTNFTWKIAHEKYINISFN